MSDIGFPYGLKMNCIEYFNFVSGVEWMHHQFSLNFRIHRMNFERANMRTLSPTKLCNLISQFEIGCIVSGVSEDMESSPSRI